MQEHDSLATQLLLYNLETENRILIIHTVEPLSSKKAGNMKVTSPLDVSGNGVRKLAILDN